MPQLSPGESKVAIATFPVSPAGLICTAELWLGSNSIKVATSGEVPFVSTGVDQSITLPITMPSIEGTYPVYLNVFSNGVLIAAFRATEDVEIGIAPPVPTGVELRVNDYWTILDVEGIPFTSVGIRSDGNPYAVLEYPIEVSELRGMSITWRCDKLFPFWYPTVFSWRLLYEPQFEAPMPPPCYQVSRAYGMDRMPKIGEVRTVKIVGRLALGYSYPGIYDGRIILQILEASGRAQPGTGQAWIKNMALVVE